jgi:metal-responsive CopG/Arc/MetJ family transcriptional regulator
MYTPLIIYGVINMKRTQVYLQESQKKELGLLAEQKGKSLAELVREAVDMYIADNRKSADKYILQTSGLWKSKDDIPDSVEYINELRNEMNKHLEDIDK